MKTIRPLVMFLAFAFAMATPAKAAFVTVDGFSDIILWAGAGTNEAGFVLQFGDSEDPTSIAWGYRWNGSRTVQDMMFAIAGSTTISGGSSPPPGLDGRLTASGDQYDFGMGPVVFISSITYDQTGLPAEWSPVSRQIVNNYAVDGTYPALYSNAGAGGIFSAPTMSFDAALVGISELGLANGGWYGFVQSDGSDPFAFTQPVSAVPEPSTWALTAAGVAGLSVWRRMYAQR